MGTTKQTDNNLTTKRRKKVLPIILGIILVLIIVVVAFVSSTSAKNIKAMNRCIDIVLEELNQHFTVTEVDPGEYKEMKLNAFMKFDVEQYDIEEIGNLSIMRVNIMGMMQMATAVITPKDKNLPLMSADYLYILSTRKAYLEFYDVVKEKDDTYNQLLDALAKEHANYSHLEDMETSEVWYAPLLTVASYKTGKQEVDADIEKMLSNSLNIYCTHAKALENLSAEAKEEKLAITVDYTNGLVERGGISTDVFKKELGDEETKKFFGKVFFGTDTP